ncbi:LutC/YkgG family protein [Nocardioides marmorisolisilvae]|uniref:Lactate utilization protein C n=1 Tax=Nocardioides marmorisolisilvae TaxID=1542737 RepID=A0A3N0DPP2_9ACTN|nr:LUD domain-containing protein [Nocardioides marmorisolisilvae]RNL77619.1 lactate utilization protein C [Nocardioides marmorisolisilvae]
MTTARDQILGDVRLALRHADRAPVRIDRGYRDQSEGVDPVARFIERVADYRAVVERCPAARVAACIAAALPPRAPVVVPAGLPWQIETAVVDSGFSAAELNRFEAAVTGATLGVAETGTLVLTHGDQEGRRAISLVPDLYVCVILATQIVATVPEAIAALRGGAVTTWISGPSATSDIELKRVEGVHGPRRLHVIVVEEAPAN